jgi:hypothetical protein
MQNTYFVFCPKIADIKFMSGHKNSEHSECLRSVFVSPSSDIDHFYIFRFSSYLAPDLVAAAIAAMATVAVSPPHCRR